MNSKIRNIIKLSSTSFEAIDNISMLIDNFIMKDCTTSNHNLDFKSEFKSNENIDI